MTFQPEEILIFLGPSLPLEEAKMLLEARYFPPAKQGDIMSLTNRFQPKVIALIDGFFSQELSVWHKEILYAMSRGVIVLGGSSMGALRAAETAAMGTIGVGKIFELYKSWEINDDDEVALLHGPKEEGYIPFSLPIVNVRFTLIRARDEGKISEAIYETFLALTKSIHYTEVTIDAIIEKATEKNLAKEAILLLKDLLENHYVDQKKEDACLVLQKIQTLPQSSLPEKIDYPFNTFFEILYDCDQRPLSPENEITQKEIAHYTALHHPDFSEIQFNAFNQFTASTLAKILQVEITKEDLESERERFYLRLRLNSDIKKKEWLSRNHLTEIDFNNLIKEKAKVRKLHQSFNVEGVPRKPIKALLSELKWTGQYEEWAKKAASQETCLEEKAPCHLDTDRIDFQDEDLVMSHLQETGWNPDIYYEKWAKEAGFENILEFQNELEKSKLARDHLKEMIFSRST